MLPEGKMTKLTGFAAVLLLAALYFAFRWPFISQPLMGEEGLTADLVVSQPWPADRTLLGRLHGLDVRVAAEHPMPIYWVFRPMGWARLFLFGACKDPDSAAQSLRWIWALWSGLIWAGALWLLRPAQGSWAWLLWAAALMGCPLAVGGSLLLQSDTSVGVALAALLGAAMAWGMKQGDGEAAAIWPMLGASFLFGFFSKQEWSFAYLAVLALLSLMSRNRWAPRHLCHSKAWAWLAACLLGVACSLAACHEAWLGGLRLLMHTSHHGAREGYWQMALKVRGPFLLALLLLWALLARQLWVRPHPMLWLGLGTSLALGLPFMLVPWGMEYRYFLPSFWVAALLWLQSLAMAPAMGSKSQGLPLVAVLLLLVSAFQVWGMARGRLSITEYPWVPVPPTYQAQAGLMAQGRQQGCVPFAALAAGWYPGSGDFMGDTQGRENAARRAQAQGLRLCQ
jgi:hypothetical protein